MQKHGHDRTWHPMVMLLR